MKGIGSPSYGGAVCHLQTEVQESCWRDSVQVWNPRVRSYAVQEQKKDVPAQGENSLYAHFCCIQALNRLDDAHSQEFRGIFFTQPEDSNAVFLQTLSETLRNIFPAVWVSLNLNKLTHKINLIGPHQTYFHL